MDLRNRREKTVRIIRRAVTLLCCAVIAFGAVYLVREQIRRHADRARDEALRELYRQADASAEPTTDPPARTPRPTDAPTPVATAIPTASQTPRVTAAPTPRAASTPTPVPTAVPTASQTPRVTAAPTPRITAAPTPRATSTPTASPAWSATPAASPAVDETDELPDVVDVPLDGARALESAKADASDAGALQPAFEALYARNPDIVGWISNGDTIDHPVLFRDNEYYLRHNFDGERDAAGAIFLDEHNRIDLSDENVLIYGHNMRSGEMFGDLDRYRDAAQLAEYPVFTLRSAWREAPFDYVVFAVFDAAMDADDADYLRVMRYNFRTREDHQAFLDALLERSLFDCPVDVTCDDPLLTLVTCSYSDDDGRLLLYGRRLRADEAPDAVKAAYRGAFSKADAG